MIRTAQADDGAAVAAVYAPYVRDTAVSFEAEPPTAAVMADRISGTLGTHPWLVAARGSDVVGYAYAGQHSQRAAYRWTVDVTVYVRDGERRTGVGHRLYRALLTTLRLQGFRSVFAEVVLPNPGSVRLHEAMGFRPIGVHKDIGHKLGDGTTSATGAWAWPTAQRLRVSRSLSPCSGRRPHSTKCSLKAGRQEADPWQSFEASALHEKRH